MGEESQQTCRTVVDRRESWYILELGVEGRPLEHVRPPPKAFKDSKERSTAKGKQGFLSEPLSEEGLVLFYARPSSVCSVAGLTPSIQVLKRTYL